MEMIDRYVYAVVSQLPEGQRAEIDRELRGLIEDMLEDREQQGIRGEAAIEEVLQELGDPRLLADSYRGEKRFLISPELFPTYLTVLKIVLVVISIVAVVGYCIEVIFDPITTSTEGIISGALRSMFEGLFQGFAWVTIAFGIIEYTGAKRKVVKHQCEWKVSDLKEFPHPKSNIKRSDPIISIIFTVLLTMIFTYSIEYFAVWLNLGEVRTVTPILNEEVFRTFLPYIWIGAALVVLKDCFKLIAGKWSMKLLTFEAILSVIGAVLIIIMANTPDIWNATFVDQLMQQSILQEMDKDFDFIQSIWNNRVQIIVVIAIVSTLGSIASLLYKMFQLRTI